MSRWKRRRRRRIAPKIIFKTEKRSTTGSRIRPHTVGCYVQWQQDGGMRTGRRGNHGNGHHAEENVHRRPGGASLVRPRPFLSQGRPSRLYTSAGPPRPPCPGWGGGGGRSDRGRLHDEGWGRASSSGGGWGRGLEASSAVQRSQF